MTAALAEDPSRPGYLESGFRLVLAVNKADLLPSAVTHTRLEVQHVGNNQSHYRALHSVPQAQIGPSTPHELT